MTTRRNKRRPRLFRAMKILKLSYQDAERLFIHFRNELPNNKWRAVLPDCFAKLDLLILSHDFTTNGQKTAKKTKI